MVSKYLRIKCNKCGEERTVFSNVTKAINCKNCGEQLAQNTGARAKMVGAKIVKVL